MHWQAHARQYVSSSPGSGSQELKHPANWLWFRVFANLALRTINSSSYNPSQLQADLRRLESFQFDSHPASGDSPGSGGWTNDGPTGLDGKEEAVWQRDYYSSSFAITFAMLVYAKVGCRSRRPRQAEGELDR